MAFMGGGCMLWCSILFKRDLVWSAIMMCGFHVGYLHMRRLTKPGFDSVANYLFPFHKQTLQADRASFFCRFLLPFQVTHRCVFLPSHNGRAEKREGWFPLSSTNLQLWRRCGGVKCSQQVLEGLIINHQWYSRERIWATRAKTSKILCISYLKCFYIRFQSDVWLSSKTRKSKPAHLKPVSFLLI